MKIRSKRTLSILLTLALLISLLPAAAIPAAALDAADPDDPGTETNPYRIGTAADLKEFRDIVNGTHATVEKNTGACAVLTADIDLEGEAWTPICTDKKHPYTGHFDGKGKEITNLTVNLTGNYNYAGFFGCIGRDGVVENLTLSGSVNVSGNMGDLYVGGVAGQNAGTIRDCAWSGPVTGEDDRFNSCVGGVVGNNAGTVADCWSSGNVTAKGKEPFAGGIVGINSSSYDYTIPINGALLNCYHFTGTVTGDGNTAHVGGVAGRNTVNTVTACYWLDGTAVLGIGDNFYGVTAEATELTEEAFQDPARFAGWDFRTTWYMGEEKPELLALLPLAGDGTAANPYRIGTAEELKAFHVIVKSSMSYYCEACAVLTANIDLGGDPDDESTWWTPIGAYTTTDSKHYVGTFDGAGYTISGLYVSGDRYHAGLFGIVAAFGEGRPTVVGVVENLTVRGSVSSSRDGASTAAAGGVAAYVDGGVIRNCRSECDVTSKSFAGGIVGRVTNRDDVCGTVEGCGNAGHVEGSLAGGIAGSIETGEIKGCRNTGAVDGLDKGNTYVGGIVGYAFGGESEIENCRNAGGVVGKGNGTKVGGIVGYARNQVSVRACCSTGSVALSGNPASPLRGGVVGDLYLQSTVTECYFNTDNAGAINLCGDNHSGSTAEGSVTDSAGLTTAQFKERSNFYAADNDSKNWDFETVWYMGAEAPILRGIPGAAGSGTAVDPYRISSAAALKRFRDLVNDGMKSLCAVLTAEINLGNEPWTPVGADASHAYTGTFDGAGHTVSGLVVDMKINDAGVVHAGLFGLIYGGTVKNLNVKGNVSVDINADAASPAAARVGGVAGTIYGSGIVQGCAFSGPVSANVTNDGASYAEAYAGGIVGENSGTVKNCRDDGSVNASASMANGSRSFAGGVAGYNDGTVTNCDHSAGAITGGDYCGGVAGSNNGTVEDCFYLTGEGLAEVAIGYDEFSEGHAAGLSAEDFQKQESFKNWDFATVWYMGADGPELWAFAQKVSTWDALRSALANGGGVRLTADVKAPSAGEALTVPDGVTATLDLAGHILDRGLTEAAMDGSVIVIDGGSLTLIDSEPDAGHDAPFTYTDPITGSAVPVSGGILTGGWTDQYGGGVYMTGGAFKMYGGTIAGNAAGAENDDRAGLGGGVYMQDGTFDMTGGTICGNKAANTNPYDNCVYGSGGGVFINSGTFDMTGGTIACNTAAQQGGGVYTEGVFTMSGGMLYCSTASEGKNVFVGQGGTGPDLVTLTLAANDGSDLAAEQALLMNTAAPIAPVAFTRAHYNFGGWDSEASGGGTAYAPGADITLSEPLTLYAQWEAITNAVAVTAGGHMTKTAASGGASQAVLEGSAMTAVVYTADTGYSFPANYSVAAVNGVSVTRDSAAQITVSGTPTAEAAIALADAAANSYTVAFDGNGATGGSMSAQAFTYDAAHALNANAFTRADHDFSGWNTASDGGGAAYADAAEVSNLTAENGATVTLYAQWTKHGTVADPIFDPAAGTYVGAQTVSITCATADATVYYVANDTEPAVYTAPISVAESTAFRAWAVKEGMIGSAEVTAAYVIEAPSYTVTVTDDGHGAGAASPASGVSGTEVRLTATPDEGYHFLAWEVVSGGVTVADGKFTIGEADVEIKAVFEADEPAPPTIYTVTVTDDGHGAGAASPASGVSGTEVTLTAMAAQGYHFKEWQVVSGGVTVADGKLTIGEADVEIKAVFEEDEPAPPPPSYDDTPADNSVTIPVAGGAVSVKVRVTGGAAALEALTDAQIAAVTASGAPLDILFDLSSLGKGITDVSIPAETFEKSVEALLKHPGADTLTIRTAQGAVTFDEKTLGAIGKQAASGGRVELHLTFSADSAAAETLNAAQRSALAGKQALALLQLTLKSGGRELTGFGGGRMTVSVPFTPPAGMQGRFCQTWYVSELGDLEHMATRFREDKLRVGMKHLSVYAVLYDPQPFTDVAEGDWFFDAVYHSYANLYFNGTGEGIFSPETGMTRAMFATVLWRMAGEPETEKASGFTDAVAGSWYDTAVAWASENGIVTGYGDGTFGVNDPVTREQMAAMLYRYLQLQGQGFKGLWAFPLDYPDAADVSDWAYEALCWLTMNGVVNGMDGTLQPKGEASRAQVAALLQRVAALSEA